MAIIRTSAKLARQSSAPIINRDKTTTHPRERRGLPPARPARENDLVHRRGRRDRVHLRRREVAQVLLVRHRSARVRSQPPRRQLRRREGGWHRGGPLGVGTRGGPAADVVSSCRRRQLGRNFIFISHYIFSIGGGDCDHGQQLSLLFAGVI